MAGRSPLLLYFKKHRVRIAVYTYLLYQLEVTRGFTLDPEGISRSAPVGRFAGCHRFTGLTFEEIVAERKTVGTKIGNNRNPAAEHGELLAAANF